MQKLPESLQKKIDIRSKDNTLRALPGVLSGVDFCSNDYLGFAVNTQIYQQAGAILEKHKIQENGAKGSRLLSGNHLLYSVLEKQLCEFHNSPSALVYGSGYAANLGFFSCIAQKQDVVLYDAYIHASIRDGIGLSHAKAYKYNHNDMRDLEQKLARFSTTAATIYIATEEVFSMDGDTALLQQITDLADKYKAFVVLDQAHAIGVLEDTGRGLAFSLGLEDAIFARIVTFGKALGAHGAAVLTSKAVSEYLINFSRSFIYTTALPPHAIATAIAAYQTLAHTDAVAILQQNIRFFKEQIHDLQIDHLFIPSTSAIQVCVISGASRVKQIAFSLQEQGFLVKPILSPTVAKGQERLRFCLHSTTSRSAIKKVLELLSCFVA